MRYFDRQHYPLIDGLKLPEPLTKSIERLDSISVVIPTYQRSEGLKAALLSVFAQENVITQSKINIIVVDNNRTAQERSYIDSVSMPDAFTLTYVHIPEAGLSNARNGAMSAVRSRFVAFLDDDMIASPQWLAAVLKTADKFEAGIVFAPAIAVMPNPADPRNAYMKPFFSSMAEGAQERIMDDTLGLGASLIDLARCELPSPAFEVAFNKTGGEDDIFFEHLRRKGAKVAWSPDAITYEIVPTHRATTEYIRTRNFVYGQAPTRIQASRGLSGLLGVLYFMCAGLAQIALYAPLYGFNRLLGRPEYVKYLALTARALGKIFWTRNFSLQLYGKTSPSVAVA